MKQKNVSMFTAQSKCEASSDFENDLDSDNICGLSRACQDDEAFTGPFRGGCATYGDGKRHDGFCVEDGACEKCQCSCQDECPLVYDLCPLDPLNDADSDDLCAGADSCPDEPLNDADGDGICHGIDLCPFDKRNDEDSDFICGDVDTCASDANNDKDSDGLCAEEDSCASDPDNDADGDRVCFPEDTCPQDSDNDRDSDNMCLNDDACPNDAENDVDSDGICGNEYCVDKAGENCGDYRRGVGRFRGLCRANAKCEVCECACGVECGNEDVCPLDADKGADADALCENTPTVRSTSKTALNNTAVSTNSNPIPSASTSAKPPTRGPSGTVRPNVDPRQTFAPRNDASTVASRITVEGGGDERNTSSLTLGPRNTDISTGTRGRVTPPPLRVQTSIGLRVPLQATTSVPARTVPGRTTPMRTTGTVIVDTTFRRSVPVRTRGNAPARDEWCSRRAGYDVDSDNVCGFSDDCPFDPDNDLDRDTICGDIDLCPTDADNDIDSDNLCAPTLPMDIHNRVVPCVDRPQFRQKCEKYKELSQFVGVKNFCVADGMCNFCGCACADACAPTAPDLCPRDPGNDLDSDSICGDVDICPYDNDDDADSDRLCGDEDHCAFDPENDRDSDGSCGDVDSCRYDPDNDIDSDRLCVHTHCVDGPQCELYILLSLYAAKYCVPDGKCVECACACAAACLPPADVCPLDSDDDADSDVVCGDVDSCPWDSDNDSDSDKICGNVDSCPVDSDNDLDSDTICLPGDACPHDSANDIDSDRLCEDTDSCPNDRSNDVDSDGICAAIDSCAMDADNDIDSDAMCADVDSCPRDAANDIDSDAVCGDLDRCPLDTADDSDSDSVCDTHDACPADPDHDADSDHICGDVDSCPRDAGNDVDSDKICGSTDKCPVNSENDADSDSLCEAVDSCPLDSLNDFDGDRVCGDADSCPVDAANDLDGDGICESADSCSRDGLNDADSDVVCGDVDSCPLDADNDVDSDRLCGEVDSCRYDAENDADSDGICGNVDSCPWDGANDEDSDALCRDADTCANDPSNDLDSDLICGDKDTCENDMENDADSDQICGDDTSCLDVGQGMDSHYICTPSFDTVVLVSTQVSKLRCNQLLATQNFNNTLKNILVSRLKFLHGDAGKSVSAKQLFAHLANDWLECGSIFVELPLLKSVSDTIISYLMKYPQTVTISTDGNQLQLVFTVVVQTPVVKIHSLDQDVRATALDITIVLIFVVLGVLVVVGALVAVRYAKISRSQSKIGVQLQPQATQDQILQNKVQRQVAQNQIMPSKVQQVTESDINMESTVSQLPVGGSAIQLPIAVPRIAIGPKKMQSECITQEQIRGSYSNNEQHAAKGTVEKVSDAAKTLGSTSLSQTADSSKSSVLEAAQTAAQDAEIAADQAALALAKATNLIKERNTPLRTSSRRRRGTSTNSVKLKRLRSRKRRKSRRRSNSRKRSKSRSKRRLALIAEDQPSQDTDRIEATPTDMEI